MNTFASLMTAIALWCGTPSGQFSTEKVPTRAAQIQACRERMMKCVTPLEYHGWKDAAKCFEKEKLVRE